MAGDESARERLVGRLRCVPRMLASKNAKLGRPLDEGELQDLTQDTLIAVWRKLNQFSGRAALETWVYRFCFLELMYKLRSSRRVPRLLDDLGEDVTRERVAPVEPSALDYEDIYGALDRLDSDEAEVLRLKHFEDWTFERIGAELEISPNTAKTRYYRGLFKLRRMLGSTTTGRGPEEEPR